MSNAVVLAVDPGRDKCGMAVMAGSRVLAKRVVPAGDLGATAARWVREFGVNRLALGDRTGRENARAALAAALPDLPIAVVDEAGTTEAARVRYFADHPPRGWRRLIPTSMQVPPEPYDDYVAVLLAERSLAGASAGGGEGPKDGTVGSWRQEEKP